MKKGKLIVIDGLDGSGKATQVQLLKDYLIDKNLEFDKDFTVVDFPRYGKESAHMVESYLHGKFGTDPNAMDPYTASMFYAIDRSISYKTELWGEVYKNGGLVVADRYTCSNFIHQASKLPYADESNFAYMREFAEFFSWLYWTEYDLIGLPKPDLIIYLKLSEEANRKMLEGRIKAGQAADIHEANKDYLEKCRKILNDLENHIKEPNSISGTYWDIDSIPHKFLKIYDDNFEVKSREEIHSDIVKIINSYKILEV